MTWTKLSARTGSSACRFRFLAVFFMLVPPWWSLRDLTTSTAEPTVLKIILPKPGHHLGESVFEIPRAWQHESQPDAVQFMIAADGDQRRINLKRTDNPALYDFPTAHLGHPGG
jgi:hypothetical protein